MEYLQTESGEVPARVRLPGEVERRGPELREYGGDLLQDFVQVGGTLLANNTYYLLTDRTATSSVCYSDFSLTINLY